VYIYFTNVATGGITGRGWGIRGLDIPAVKRVKVKFSPEQATKSQRGSRGIALIFL